MKKICIITTVHPHDDVRIFHKQARALAKAGYRVCLLCPDFEGEADGITCYRIPVPKGRLGRMLQSSRAAYRRAALLEADLYHIHDPELLPLADRLRKEGRRVVYDVHEDLPKQILVKPWLPEWARKPLAKWFGRYEQRVAAGLTGVICATGQIAGRFPGSILFCNYPDGEEISQEVYASFPPYGTRRPRPCYLGSISAIRGIEQMVRALEGTGFRLQLAGNYETAALKIETQRLPAYAQVDYHGHLDRGEVTQLLGSCTMGLVVLQPTENYRESIPIKLLEYLLAGLPVVASDFPYWRELVGEQSVLYVDPSSPQEIRKAMEFYQKNPDRAQKMGEKGRELVLERYCLQTEVNRLLRYYSRWLGEEKGGRKDEHSAD